MTMKKTLSCCIKCIGSYITWFIHFLCKTAGLYLEVTYFNFERMVPRDKIHFDKVTYYQSIRFDNFLKSQFDLLWKYPIWLNIKISHLTRTADVLVTSSGAVAALRGADIDVVAGASSFSLLGLLFGPKKTEFLAPHFVFLSFRFFPLRKPRVFFFPGSGSFLFFSWEFSGRKTRVCEANESFPQQKTPSNKRKTTTSKKRGWIRLENTWVRIFSLFQ